MVLNKKKRKNYDREIFFLIFSIKYFCFKNIEKKSIPNKRELLKGRGPAYHWLGKNQVLFPRIQRLPVIGSIFLSFHFVQIYFLK